MKKLISVLLSVLLCFALCGCKAVGNSGNDRRFMVSAIGFETDGARITVSVETVIVNSETADVQPKPQVLSAEGETIDEALQSVGAALPKPMLLEHCGVIVIGQNMTPAWFKKIADYCFYENRITLSAYMIAAKNPTELLSGEPKSSVAVGYDIMGVVERQSRATGVSYDSRYFEIESRRERGRTVFALPYFEKSDDGVQLNGMQIFKDDAPVIRLNDRESALYALMTGSFEEGTVRVGADEYNVKARKVTYGYTDGGEKTVTLKLTLRGDALDELSCESLSHALEDLEKALKTALKADGFGFTERLSERFSDFRANHGDSDDFYNAADFHAECRAE